MQIPKGLDYYTTQFPKTERAREKERQSYLTFSLWSVNFLIGIFDMSYYHESYFTNFHGYAYVAIFTTKWIWALVACIVGLITYAVLAKLLCFSTNTFSKAVGMLPGSIATLLGFSYIVAVPYGLSVVLHHYATLPPLFFLYIALEVALSTYMLTFFFDKMFFGATRQDDHLSEIDGYAYSDLQQEADEIKEEFRKAREEATRKTEEIMKANTMKDAVVAGATKPAKPAARFPIRLNSEKQKAPVLKL